MAVLHFAEEGVEIAVFEAGMGGRLDATNALNGLLCVLTPVSLDHTDYLGRAIGEIAREKVGICKRGAPIVSARQHADAARVIARQASGLGSPLYLLGEDFDACWEEGKLSYRGLFLALGALSAGLPGRYQSGNQALALAACELLSGASFPVSPQAMAVGVERARWPGRMELFTGEPRVLLDGAHNPAGAAVLSEALADIPYNRLLMVVGVMGDKELPGILSPLLPLADRVFAVAPAIERALPAKDLALFCRKAGVTAFESGPVAQGLAQAQALAGADDLVLVCGSLFTVGEARGILLSRRFEPFRG
jgi:dihydrofolate synthase/folylpolyglutamate synthase